VRRTRTITLVAAALIGTLSLAGCAKDSGGGGTNTGGTTSAAGGCQTPNKPAPVAGSAGASTSAGAKPNASALKVGLAYDIGGRGDASFNDAAAAGLDKAKTDLGVTDVKELTAAPSESEDAKQTRLRNLADGGYNPIVAVGFAYTDALTAVAPKYPNIKFAIIDSTVDGATNVTPLTFAENEGSFLVGVVAALKSKKCHIGFVGGVETPLIKKFEAGFTQGASTIAPDVKIETKYLTPAGDFSGFQDPAKGQEATKGQIDAGADVVYQAAGASGKGVFAAAKEGGIQAIGVDSDQYNQPTVAQYKDVIISSMLKRVDVAVYDYISAIAGNNLTTLPKVFDLKVDGVGYSTSGGKIDDITGVVNAYKQQIISGRLAVKETP
jgi:basic membrane protein A